MRKCLVDPHNCSSKLRIPSEESSDYDWWKMSMLQRGQLGFCKMAATASHQLCILQRIVHSKRNMFIFQIMPVKIIFWTYKHVFLLFIFFSDFNAQLVGRHCDEMMRTCDFCFIIRKQKPQVLMISPLEQLASSWSLRFNSLSDEVSTNQAVSTHRLYQSF